MRCSGPAMLTWSVSAYDKCRWLNTKRSQAAFPSCASWCLCVGCSGSPGVACIKEMIGLLGQASLFRLSVALPERHLDRVGGAHSVRVQLARLSPKVRWSSLWSLGRGRPAGWAWPHQGLTFRLCQKREMMLRDRTQCGRRLSQAVAWLSSQGAAAAGIPLCRRLRPARSAAAAGAHRWPGPSRAQTRTTRGPRQCREPLPTA